MTGEYHQHTCPGKNPRKRLLACAIVLLLFLTAAVLPGCLRIIQHPPVQENVTRNTLTPSQTARQDPGGSPAATQEIPPGMSEEMYQRMIASRGQASQSPSASVPAVANPTSLDLVTSALPELTPDPYPGQHAVQINASDGSLRQVRLAEFRQTYTLRGNSTGLVVNATTLKGPLWIWFEVKPLYDCIENPDSCRGKTGKSISLPYLTITVRDNQTREIVAEDGYGRIYSSQTTNRTIKIYREGRYHLTLTGDSVDVTLAVATGAAPVLNETQQAAGSSPTKTLPPEILRQIRGGA